MYAKDYAISTGNKCIFDFLINRGANINATDWSGRSLHDYLSADQKNWLGV